MMDNFKNWIKEIDIRPKRDGYIIPEQLLKSINEHPELLEAVIEDEVSFTYRFNGQDYKFYRAG